MYNMNIEQLAQDKEFMATLKDMKSVEEITAAVNAKGVDISVEQMAQALEQFLAQQENGELSEENLDAVSGGGIIGGILLFWCAASIICGALAGLTSCSKKRR